MSKRDKLRAGAIVVGLISGLLFRHLLGIDTSSSMLAMTLVWIIVREILMKYAL